MILGEHECMCMCKLIRISTPQIPRDLMLKNFFFCSLVSPGMTIHVITQSPRLLPSHGSAFLKSSPQSHLHLVSRWGKRMQDGFIDQAWGWCTFFPPHLLALICSQGCSDSKGIWDVWSRYVELK